jgi:hypothetical protein
VQWFDSDDPVDPWKHNHNEKLFGNDLDQLNEKKGIWIHVTNPVVTEFVCYGNKPTVNPEITMKPGWNLVGYPSLTANQRSLGLNDLNFGSDIDVIQWYDPISSSWHFMGPDDQFIPGRGYWIHSKVDSIWEVPQ